MAKRRWMWVLIALGVLLVVFAGTRRWRLGPGLAPEVLREFQTVDVVELVTLIPGPPSRSDPNAPDVPGELRHFGILSRSAVKDPAMRESLLQALNQSVKEADGVNECFNPRHALHIESKGHAMDLVICFECKRYELFDGDQNQYGRLSKSAEETFRRAARQLGLRVAE